MTREKLTTELAQILLEDYGLSLKRDEVFLIGQQLTDLFEDLIYGKEAENGKTQDKK